MQLKKNQFSLVFIFCLSLSGVQAQNMYVKPLSGTQTIYPIANIQKITFSSGNILVSPVSGTVGTHSLSDNRYISFTDLSTLTTNEHQSEESFYVYPNPVKDVLNLSGTAQGQLINGIEIISLEGCLLFQQEQINSSPPQIDVSILPKGMYLCKITNGSTTQIIKFLKQ